MSIGAYILTQVGTNDTFAGLPADLDCAVTEIRVEQHFDRRATFAIRFQEDFEDGEAKTITSDKLRGAKGMAIVVDGGSGLTCLIRGQVENSQSDVSAGGSGSWHEVRGQDVRTIAARQHSGGALDGSVFDIARVLADGFLSGTFYPETTPSDFIAKFDPGYPFRYGGSKLAALERLAKLCDCPVRLGYTLTPGGIDPESHEQQFDITVDVHFEPSPPRGNASPGAEVNLDLISGETTQLRIMGSEGACENVVNFALQSDNEAFSSVSASVVSLESGEEVVIDDQTATHDAMTPDGQDVETTGAEGERKLRINFCGPEDLAAAAARAAANEASWYVKANALTTVHMVGKVLQPHDIVEVVGGGCGLNGRFQVEKVVHVINAAGHWMHLDLRSNSSSLKEAKAGLTDG